MNREDKRVRRTRKALAEALIDLTIEQGYEPVTIQEITGRAGVGYRTFFRHYSDKDALLQDVLRGTITELRQLVGTPPQNEAANGSEATDPGAGYQPLPAENGRIIFEHIAAYGDLYRVLFNSGDVVLEPVMEYARREALASLDQLSDPPVPPTILAQHMVVTTFALAQWWLENEMPYPPQEMADYLARLVAVPGA